MTTNANETAPNWVPPPKIEDLYNAGKVAGNVWSAINAPTAGARVEKDAEIGSAPFQLYSMATPNGMKVGIMLEELGLDYDAHVINISQGDQFTSGFVAINPNSKIPCAVDNDGPDAQPIKLFESASIVLYLAEKHQRFLPQNPRLKVEVMNWVFWQMGGLGPFTGQFGHFFVYAPPSKCEARDYGVSRYGMEVQRLLDVLNKHLEGKTFLVGEEYTIADIICYPWCRAIQKGYKNSSANLTSNDFLSMNLYTNVLQWMERLEQRPAVQRGVTVCSNGVPKPWLVVNADEKK